MVTVTYWSEKKWQFIEMPFNKENFVFFLGGNDLEMQEIRTILAAEGCQVVDKNLGWGASIQNYQGELFSLASHKVAVLIELGDAQKYMGKKVIIDHHNADSKAPASILQVLSLLGLKPTYRQELVAANDSGYIPAMKELGANAAEIMAIRRADWQAQGITEQQVAEAETAITNAKNISGITVVELPHSKTAPVTDTFFAKGITDVLVVSADGEVNYSGNGKTCQQIKEIADTFEGGASWSGGTGLGLAHGLAYAGFSGKPEAIQSVKKFLSIV